MRRASVLIVGFLLLASASHAADTVPAAVRAAARAGDRIITSADVRAGLVADGVDPDHAPADAWAIELNKLIDRAVLAEAGRRDGLKGTDDEVVNKYLSEKFGAQLFVSNEEVQRWYDAHKNEIARPERRIARVITLGRPLTARDAMTRITAIRESTVGGTDFSALARKLSMDACAAEGGLLPPVESPAQPGTLGAEVLTLAHEGDISPVFETPLGYHIVKLDRIVPKKVPPLTEVEPGIRQALYAEKWNGVVVPHVRQLRLATCVELY